MQKVVILKKEVNDNAEGYSSYDDPYDDGRREGAASGQAQGVARRHRRQEEVPPNVRVDQPSLSIGVVLCGIDAIVHRH